MRLGEEERQRERTRGQGTKRMCKQTVRAGRMCKLCLRSEQVNFSCGGLQRPIPGSPIAGHGFPERELVCSRPPGGFLVESACKLPPN